MKKLDQSSPCTSSEHSVTIELSTFKQQEPKHVYWIIYYPIQLPKRRLISAASHPILQKFGQRLPPYRLMYTRTPLVSQVATWSSRNTNQWINNFQKFGHRLRPMGP